MLRARRLPTSHQLPRWLITACRPTRPVPSASLPEASPPSSIGLLPGAMAAATPRALHPAPWRFGRTAQGKHGADPARCWSPRCAIARSVDRVPPASSRPSAVDAPRPTRRTRHTACQCYPAYARTLDPNSATVNVANVVIHPQRQKRRGLLNELFLCLGT